MYGYGSLQLFPSVTEWRFSDHNWGSSQSDYRRWPVQVTYPLLLGVLAGIILVDSWEFPLHQVSTWPWYAPVPPFPVVSFSILPFIHSPNSIPQDPIPNMAVSQKIGIPSTSTPSDIILRHIPKGRSIILQVHLLNYVHNRFIYNSQNLKTT